LPDPVQERELFKYVLLQFDLRNHAKDNLNKKPMQLGWTFSGDELVNEIETIKLTGNLRTIFPLHGLPYV